MRLAAKPAPDVVAPGPCPLDKTIIELFQANVRAAQDAIALDQEGRTLSHGALDAFSLALKLKDIGVGPGAALETAS